MLDTTRDSFDFKDLERRLQQRLQVEFPQIDSLQVNCFFSEKTFVILVHLPELVTLPTKDILFQLKQILSNEESISSYPMELYLKVNDRGSLAPVASSHLPTFSLKSQKSLGIGLKIGLGIFLFLGGLYGLSRPCVVGSSCANLTQAKTNAQNAVNSVSISASLPDIQQSKQQLDESLNLLQDIPYWSRYHEQASQLIKIYQQQSQDLENLSQALNYATKAVSLANPPLSIPQWQTVQNHWKQAISFLKKLSVSSPYYFYTQLKLRQYQGNLTLIEQRMNAETQASDRLKSAQETAQIALVRQKNAQSLDDWKLVEATWKTAISSLQSIPSSTVATREAKNLLKIYNTQLVNATERKSKEANSNNLYTKSLQQAELAQKSAASQQWTSAVTAWRNAITNLKQIPANSSQYNQALPLITSYLVSLKQAETNLTSAVQLQNIRQDLETTCKIPHKICDYQISQAIIKVNLTESYVKQVWYTAVQAKAQTSVPTQVSLLNHIAKLEKSLQIISDHARKRVEVYNPEQNIIAIYEPTQ
ncbi:hypothetical protein C7H19_05350 [Aphanothece hegewaldii CCALA 016]|uniref:Uncharacterized protein n=1 Tax=Aphanothece hegewaldii CCALA 016 TaxID=2107694 RepID=A0A2T1M133_9CHRO|nr:hypothetical protein [Aphanothece hegewaldii]PSF38413.1 hypothetical protein C7H19_05350 [Aphanothece hegewaldii CCALA 016]